MAKKVALKVIGYGFMDETFLMNCFNHGVLVIDELPENLQIKIRRQKEIKEFLESPQKYFSALEKEGTLEEIEKTASLLLNFLPELIAQNLLNEAEKILRQVKKAGFHFTNMDCMLIDEIISSIENRMEDCSKKEQMRMLEMIDLMDTVSIYSLINFMTHNSRLVRKVTCEKLIKHGKAVIPVLKGTLEKRKDWYFIRNALMVLGEAGKGLKELEETFKQYLTHGEPRVRVEAVKGLFNIMGADAEKLFLDSLCDDDNGVRRKAAWALGEIKSLKPEVISYFIDTINGKYGVDESAIEQVLSSIKGYPPEKDETRHLEQAILEVLSKGSSILGKLTTQYTLKEHLKIKACEALGSIGSQTSIETLQKLSKKHSATKEKAQEAIEKITQRCQ
jgi:HEAT repeat protein